MSFIENLELNVAPDAYASIFARASDDETAMVGAGQATGFAAGVSFQSKEDVMNSTLLAQLAAGKKYDRLKQADQWYGEYRYVLERMGWQVTNFKLERRIIITPVSVDKLVLDYLKDTTAESSLAARIVAALEKSNDLAVKIFVSSSTIDNRSNFQLGTCVEDRARNIVFSIGGFSYSTSEKIVNPLHNTIKEGTDFHNTFQTMILNTAIYSQFRELVIQKLGVNVREYIRELILPPKN
ncbi:hypothetical protein BJ912DRAFT_1061041 [Pholiota molesta]|nr:hypothetical protein BJ912DRAFT_1061041 [Pholiota molesta]